MIGDCLLDILAAQHGQRVRHPALEHRRPLQVVVAHQELGVVEPAVALLVPARVGGGGVRRGAAGEAGNRVY